MGSSSRHLTLYLHIIPVCTYILSPMPYYIVNHLDGTYMCYGHISTPPVRILWKLKLLALSLYRGGGYLYARSGICLFLTSSMYWLHIFFWFNNIFIRVVFDKFSSSSSWGLPHLFVFIVITMIHWLQCQ